MPLASDAAPLDQIIELAYEIIDKRPSCAGTASEIATWATEIRERRPDREELTALVDGTCPDLPAEQRTQLIDGLRAFVRFAESRTTGAEPVRAWNVPAPWLSCRKASHAPHRTLGFAWVWPVGPIKYPMKCRWPSRRWLWCLSKRIAASVSSTAGGISWSTWAHGRTSSSSVAPSSSQW